MEIQVRGLSRRYFSEGREIRALDRVDLTIPANRIFTLLGPSGCGKTTLLRCIVGLETPDEGEIVIGGETVFSKAKGTYVPPEKRGLGMVFQTYAIWPHMNVFDNVAYPLQVRGMAREAVRERVARTLAFVQLEGYESRPATRLSGGQQQRVALARALVAEPKVILFDEPLSNLDAKLREETRKELKAFLGKLNITALGDDSRTAWALGEPFSNPSIQGGTRSLHPENVGVTLTREERVMLIRAIDLGGQYYSRQNTSFVPMTAGQ